MPLTELEVKSVKQGAKPQRKFDGGGMYLEVSPAGGKLWRLKYRFEGKEKRLALGAYPGVSLKVARLGRDAARKLLASGVDPSAERKAVRAAGTERAANSFEAVAREWFAKQKTRWVEGHSSKIIARLEQNVFPWIGARPIADITALEVLKVLERIEKRGAMETTHRALQNVSRVFRFAVVTGRAQRDPTPDLRGALTPVNKTHHASITDPAAVGGLLRAVDGYDGTLVTKCALRLAPLLFVRPGELRHAEWCEIDLDAAEWNIPAGKMKMRQPHLVPLSTQAVAILKELLPVTGRGRYVFPGARSDHRPMSENAVLAALRRMGFEKTEITGHGFRAMARTILDEVLGVRPDFIEHQLAHAVRDPNGRAYNRTTHLAERKKMMQQWADYLDSLSAGNSR